MPRRAVSPAASENEFDITKSLFAVEESDDEDFAVTETKKPDELDANAIFDSDGDEEFIKQQQAASNRKATNVKGKSVKKGGGFQAMGAQSLQVWLLIF